MDNKSKIAHIFFHLSYVNLLLHVLYSQPEIFEECIEHFKDYENDDIKEWTSAFAIFVYCLDDTNIKEYKQIRAFLSNLSLYYESNKPFKEIINILKLNFKLYNDIKVVEEEKENILNDEFNKIKNLLIDETGESNIGILSLIHNEELIKFKRKINENRDKLKRQEKINKNLEEKEKNFQSEKLELENNLNKEKIINKKLNEELNQLNDVNMKIKLDLSSYKTSNELLISKNINLTNEISKLKEEIKNLNEKVMKIEKENNELKEKFNIG